MKSLKSDTQQKQSISDFTAANNMCPFEAETDKTRCQTAGMSFLSLKTNERNVFQKWNTFQRENAPVLMELLHK